MIFSPSLSHAHVRNLFAQVVQTKPINNYINSFVPIVYIENTVVWVVDWFGYVVCAQKVFPSPRAQHLHGQTSHIGVVMAGWTAVYLLLWSCFYLFACSHSQWR